MRVITSPKLLVELFGVPELIRLPAKVGHEINFQAHSKTWQAGRISRQSWFVAEANGRGFVGSEQQIADAIGIILETGTLPVSENSIGGI